MTRIAIIFLFSITMMSCAKDEPEVDCTTMLPPPNYFEIAIIDNNGHNLLENIDSLRMYNSTFDKYIKPTPFSNNEYLQIRYTEITSGSTYYIEFSGSDTDTLKCEFTTTENYCFDSFTMQQIAFNGKVQVIENTYLFKLVK